MERISGRQVVMIGAVMASAATLITMPAQIFATAKQDAWFALLPAALLCALMLWLLARVMRRFPDADLCGALVGRLPRLGRLVVISYLVFFLFILARDIRLLTDFTNITLLPATPLVIIALLIGLCAIGGARGGIEVLARLTELFGPTYLVNAAVLPVLLAREFTLQNFQPFFEEGLLRPFLGAWYPVAYLGEIVALPLICANRTFTFRRGLYGLLLGTGVLSVLCVLGQGVVGFRILERTLYPAYELVRTVRVTDFLDRMDLFFVGLYMPVLLTKIAIDLYLLCHGLRRIAPSISPRLIATPLGLFGTVCSLWFFPTTVQVIHLNRTWPVLALGFELGIPLLLFAFLRPKKGEGRAPDSAQPAEGIAQHGAV